MGLYGSCNDIPDKTLGTRKCYPKTGAQKLMR